MEKIYGNQTFKPLSDVESAMIRSLRVICIFFMLYAHVSPFSPEPSFVRNGSYAWISYVWVDIFSRASVATLSLISGYLAITAIDSGPILRFVKNRARVLLIPMMFWNCVFIVMGAAATAVGKQSTVLDYFASGGVWPYINALTGLGGPPVSQALFFLRDLFVCSVLIALTWPVLRRMQIIAFLLVLTGAVFDVFAPLIFRPSILVFMLAGCIIRSRNWRLTDLVRLAPALTCAGVCLVVYMVLLASGSELAPITDAENLLKRAILTSIGLLLSSWIARTRLQPFFDRLEPVSYLTYLSHTRVISVLWLLVSINPMSPIYLFFFFLAPVAAFCVALALQPLLAQFPSWATRIIQGKPVRPPRLSPVVP